MFEGLLKFLIPLINFFGQKNRIEDIDSLRSFVSSQSSYMAQVSLYGYLKARAGTSYISLIKDPLFASSMKNARNRIFFACLIDLTLHVLKKIHSRKKQNIKNLDSFARQFFIQTLANAPEEVFENLERKQVILKFEKNLRKHNWMGTNDLHESFSGSRSELLKWAPVVEEFKIQDAEIVSNSIHFKWMRVCQEFEKLIDFENILLEADPENNVPKGA